jgi:hypothetical protein
VPPDGDVDPALPAVPELPETPVPAAPLVAPRSPFSKSPVLSVQPTPSARTRVEPILQNTSRECDMGIT